MADKNTVEISGTSISAIYPSQSDLLSVEVVDLCIEGDRPVHNITELLDWLEEAVGDINGGKLPVESVAFQSLSNAVDGWEKRRRANADLYDRLKTSMDNMRLNIGGGL